MRRCCGALRQQLFPAKSVKGRLADSDDESGSTNSGFDDLKQLPNGSNVAGHEKRRSHSSAIFRVRCGERPADEDGGADGADYTEPVKLVVFDLDETITMATFMRKDGYCPEDKVDFLRMINFESTFVQGNRIEKLRKFFDDLQVGKNGLRRRLAILTRNERGVSGVLKLLELAELQDKFCAVWTMPWKPNQHNGAYRQGEEWHVFNPPLDEIPDHKADVLEHMSNQPERWLPQLRGPDADKYVDVATLKPESMVLVDDQRSNFQSPSGIKVRRYCKVARYDSEHYNMGVIRDMGGLGAHSDADYWTVLRFVQDPWMCKENYQVRCLQRDMEEAKLQSPIKLIVLDFDETLTLATFIPEEEGFRQQLGYKLTDTSCWTEEDLITYNFQSPYGSGDRVAKLRKMLEDLTTVKEDGIRRVLAVLTRNENGVVAVTNMLKLSGLADCISAVWTLPYSDKSPCGCYQENGVWKTFETPIRTLHCHKVDVIYDVIDNPSAWFPQLLGPEGKNYNCLLAMKPESVALVDDERANFRSDKTFEDGPDTKLIMRFCKVARYDEAYRDCGTLNQMGGIGAHNDSDYSTIVSFISAPWNFPYVCVTEHEERVQRAQSKMMTIHASEENCPNTTRINYTRTSGRGDDMTKLNRERLRKESEDQSPSNGSPRDVATV
eukprot:TRINITY_DN111252_c0_g1_i1.p1 TRINITY_DN111252_c0_g1~~TRINITY_DN111252_c0_g1_i1.p1  ORF type:complete len:665 (-),score=134.57 TRINITY_DN111252_c0_g1_i1:306-2300(-)